MTYVAIGAMTIEKTSRILIMSVKSLLTINAGTLMARGALLRLLSGDLLFFFNPRSQDITLSIRR